MEFCPRRKRQVSGGAEGKCISVSPGPCPLNFRPTQHISQASPPQPWYSTGPPHGDTIPPGAGTAPLSPPQARAAVPAWPTSPKPNHSGWLQARLFPVQAVAGARSRVRSEGLAPQKGRGRAQRQHRCASQRARLLWPPLATCVCFGGFPLLKLCSLDSS